MWKIFIEFSINAWNFGNIKIRMSREEFNNVDNLLQEQENEVDLLLLNNMIDFKIKKY